jgi:hypothetical protein
MMINRDNYEAYFLDFAEGRLSPQQEEMLHRFLKFNPDLEEELRSFRIHNLTPQSFSYPGKEALKKEYPAGVDAVTSANFDMYCIAYLEKDLTEKQRTVFEEYLAEHPETEQHFIAYRATFLRKEHIIFPGKERLKHRRGKVFNWKVLVPLAAAAAVAVYIIVSQPVQDLPVEMATVIIPKEKEELVNEPAPLKKHVPEPASVNLKVIRNSTSPIPVSNYKKKEQDKDELKEEKSATASESVRIASLNFKPVRPMDIPVGADLLSPEIISPIAVNKSSFSLIELARYRVKRATETIEEEDALLWSLASSGLKELNRIRGTETELMASRNEQGEISGIQFRSRFLNVSAPLNRSED